MSICILKEDINVYDYLNDSEAYKKPRGETISRIEANFDVSSDEAKNIYKMWRENFITSDKL